MLGASTLCFYNKDPQKAAEKLAENFKLIEVVSEGYVPLSKKHKMPEVALSMHAPFSDINIASANKGILEASLKEMKNAIEIVHYFGATILTIHPGRISPQTFRSPSITKKINRDSLEQLNAWAEENDVVLSLENMPESSTLIGKTPQDMEEMIKAIHSKNLRMTLDIGHAHTTKNLYEFTKLKKYIINIHLHDNRGTDDHLSLGRGTIDLERFFREFGEYRGNAILELEKIEGMKESKMIVQRLLK